MGSVRRIYVEKKKAFAVKAKELQEDIGSFLGIGVEDVRVFIRYDVENISDEVFERACRTVFSEPPVDELYREDIKVPANARVFSVEFLPGQFDQRADSAVQCVQFLKEDEEPVIRTAVTYMILGDITEEEFARIKAYCINPVDSRETGLEKPDTLVAEFEEPGDVALLQGFARMEEGKLRELYDSLSLAMTFKDFLHIQKYFGEDERRDPTMTEIRVLDTYWSDHCRHTTFSTELTEVEFGEGYYRTPLETTYRSYLDTREEVFAGRTEEGHSGKFICLMDLALMAMRKLKKEGKLSDMEESDEINACSVVVPVGAACHMDGACIATIYEIVLCCALFGHPLNSVGDFAFALVIAVAGSVAVSSVPGGGAAMETMVISAFGFPAAALPVLLMMTQLFDAGCTLINSCGDTVASMLVTRILYGKDWYRENLNAGGQSDE